MDLASTSVKEYIESVKEYPNPHSPNLTPLFGALVGRDAVETSTPIWVRLWGRAQSEAKNA
jgi:hypothetical protein